MSTISLTMPLIKPFLIAIGIVMVAIIILIIWDSYEY